MQPSGYNIFTLTDFLKKIPVPDRLRRLAVSRVAAGAGPAMTLAVLLGLLASYQIYSQRLKWPVIRVDGYGYYAYLPAIFIHRDLSLETLAREQFGGVISEKTGIRRYAATGLYLDKYTVGTALLETPFFLIGHAFALLEGVPADGFSEPYQYAIVAAGLFYLGLGIFFSHRFLRRQLSPAPATAALLVLVFGTNLFHYATYDCCFSHIYSFALVSLFLELTDGFYRTPTKKCAFAVGLLLGVICCVRVTNAVVVVIFVLWGVKGRRELRERLTERRTLALYLVFVCGAIVGFAPQMAYWQYAAGQLLVNSYVDEGFNWLTPHVFDVLFSVNKGLFFWCPVLFLAVAGLWAVKSRLPGLFLPLTVYHLLQLYVVSSWHSWFYGGGLGQRPYVDAMPVFAISLAALFAASRDWKLTFSRGGEPRRSAPAWAVLAAVSIPPILINVLFTLGYWKNIIPYNRTNLFHLVYLVKWVLSWF